MALVIVSGALANKHANGGATWTRLSWALGLKKLGFQVCFVEQIARDTCVDDAGMVAPFEQSANLAYFKRVVEQFALASSAALIYEAGERIHGASYAELLDLADAAELLVNITGHLTLEPLLRRIRRKVYVDLDPGFTQFWYATGSGAARLDGHDFYFSVGENIGTPHCSIPTAGIPWRPIRQPVLLEQWPVLDEGVPDRFTTVASWRGPYGPVEYRGVAYGLKVHEFRKFIRLPEEAPGTFELALDIQPAETKDLALLSKHGWRVVDPKRVANDPLCFRQYIQASGAEFSVAQGIYVQTGSGWFSDRTVRYLASGKPALVQDTGFSHNYPTGEGLIAFRTLNEAVAGAERIQRDYHTHSRAARALAEGYFHSDTVLGQFIDQINRAR